MCSHACRYYLGSIPVYVVTDSDMLKQILVKQFDNFTDRFPVSKSSLLLSWFVLKLLILFQLDKFESMMIALNGGLPLDLLLLPGDEWKKSRRLVSPTFSSKSLRLVRYIEP